MNRKKRKIGSKSLAKKAFVASNEASRLVERIQQTPDIVGVGLSPEEHANKVFELLLKKVQDDFKKQINAIQAKSTSSSSVVDTGEQLDIAAADDDDDY